MTVPSHWAHCRRIVRSVVPMNVVQVSIVLVGVQEAVDSSSARSSALANLRDWGYLRSHDSTRAIAVVNGMVEWQSAVELSYSER